jgi:protein transport protein SEC24
LSAVDSSAPLGAGFDLAGSASAPLDPEGGSTMSGGGVAALQQGIANLSVLQQQQQQQQQQHAGAQQALAAAPSAGSVRSAHRQYAANPSIPVAAGSGGASPAGSSSTADGVSGIAVPLQAPPAGYFSPAPGAQQQQQQQQQQQYSTAGGGAPAAPLGLPSQSDVPPPNTAHQCPAAYVQVSVNALPATSQLQTQAALPIGAVIHPLREDGPPVPLIDFGQMGIMRCRRCRAYVSAARAPEP